MEEKTLLEQINIEEFKEKHICPVCGKECKLGSHSSKKNSKWNLFCSNECKHTELGKEIARQSLKKTREKKYSSHEEYVRITKEKRKQTNLKKFGVENPFQSKEIQEKIYQTNIEKYGYKSPLQNDSIKEKQQKTCEERYHSKNVMGCEKIKKKIVKTFRKTRYEYFLKSLSLKKIIPLFDSEKYINSKHGDNLHFKCERCGKEFVWEVGKTSFEIRKIRCPDPSHKSSSKAEQEIYDWLVSIGITNIERNKRDWDSERVFEADLYLPDYKLVIEYNGLYWHSNLNHNKNYHFNKWKYFKDQNIDCIQIFENEWGDKSDIVKSIILNKLGKNKRIFARNCIIKEISNNEYENFLNENHIQGYCQAKIKLGLFYENELVEAMSFSKPRFNKKYDWENIRTCTKIGYNIVGGFSKLLNFFKKKYGGSIISYIDSRYFSGGGYLKNNFQCVGHSNPNYFYFKTSTIELFTRISFQKHKLKDNLEIYNENLSEKENMTLNDYLWIYDCGNDIMVCEDSLKVCDHLNT